MVVVIGTIEKYSGTVNPGTVVGTIINLTDSNPFYVTGYIDLSGFTSAITGTVSEYISQGGGTYRKYAESVYSGEQDLPQIRFPNKLIPGGGGYRVTVITGTAVDIPYTFMQIKTEVA